MLFPKVIGLSKKGHKNTDPTSPTLDIIIYAEPINKVYLQGIIAAISNSVTVGILGTFLINTYSKTRVKKGSLDRE